MIGWMLIVGVLLLLASIGLLLRAVWTDRGIDFVFMWIAFVASLAFLLVGNVLGLQIGPGTYW